MIGLKNVKAVKNNKGPSLGVHAGNGHLSQFKGPCGAHSEKYGSQLGVPLFTLRVPIVNFSGPLTGPALEFSGPLRGPLRGPTFQISGPSF